MNTWFSIRAQTDAQGHDAVVAIRDFIGIGTGAADEFVAALDASKAKRPLIEINSRGGSVLDSVAIYAAIASLDATVRIRGLALSAASYIASAAKRVEIVANGWLMLHAPRTEAGGTASELTDVAKQLAAFEADYRSAYMRKSGKDEATVSAWLSKDTWMNAQDALAAGLVNVILPAAAFTASADVAAIPSAPKQLIDMHTKTKAAAPGEVIVGDYVELSYQDGTTKGLVAELMTTGTVNGNDGSVEATADDPAALVEVLKEVGTTGQFTETDVVVARLLSTLTRVEPPVIVETEMEDGGGMDAKAKISASTNAGNQTTMNATDRILAILRVKKGAEDTFLASAIEALGIPADAVTEARKAGSTDFLATTIKARIDEFEATAKTATDRANAILAAVGVKADAPDIAAEVAKTIDAKAAAKAADILASHGIKPTRLAAAAGKPGEDATNRDEIVAKFNAMKAGPERTAFFNKHRKTLLS